MVADNEIIGLPDEESVDKLTETYSEEIVKVIFTNTFQYHLKFLLGYRIPIKKEHHDHTGTCQLYIYITLYLKYIRNVSMEIYVHIPN